MTSVGRLPPVSQPGAVLHLYAALTSDCGMLTFIRIRLMRRRKTYPRPRLEGETPSEIM